MTDIVIVYLTIFVPILAAGLACGLIAGLIGGAWWQRRRDWRPIPLVPSDAVEAVAIAVTCRWCAKRPTGRCTCGVWCGHKQCPRFTRADMDYLDNGTEMPR